MISYVRIGIAASMMGSDAIDAAVDEVVAKILGNSKIRRTRAV